MYTSVYSVTVKKRKGPQKGQTIKEGRTYQTKSLTSMHAWLRAQFGARTFKGGQLIKYFCAGMIPLPEPFVTGGEEIK